VPPANAEALASAIEEALSMRASARQSLAHYAREHVHKNFSIEKMQRSTLDVYRSLLKNF
jgi:glycosyltransferase involved in cell wall biosynthesis